MKTAIVTDSTAYLPADVREKNNIHMIPLQVTFGLESFEEEQELTVDEFYRKSESEMPKTSQPSIGEFINLFKRLSESYDEIVTIHLSGGISGTYAGAIQAGELVENLEVYAFDSEISCAMQGFYALKAAEMANSGSKAKAILQELEKMKKTMKAYFMVEDLKHFQRGGRLSGAQALVGGMLQIKPLLHFKETKIVPFEKIRTRKKAMNRMVYLLQEDVRSGDQFRASIIHANREEDATDWKKELEQQFPSVEFDISYFGPVIGVHLGEGSMGLGWVKK
ncbi:DegV family protein [Planomicrobium sp. Y74]|uniref:DegV family protein n=1 Tax=Planomicrobium sp. Y74 TaxID=2478977 RepID=UPI000EF46EA4|nr:DegV family protein [Planomicrobium sp. Y74]RLQ93060.1 DegV family protein [Planomicrobium sp. Y74]